MMLFLLPGAQIIRYRHVFTSEAYKFLQFGAGDVNART